MQPQDPFSPPPAPTPDVPDAAMPSIEPVPEQSTYNGAPAPTPPPPTPQTFVAPPQPQASQQPQAPQQTPIPGQPNHGNTQHGHPGQPIAPDQGRSHLSSVGRKYFNLIEFDPEEQLLAEIRKHPFGLLIIMLTGLFIAFVIFAGVAGLVSSGFLTSLGFGSMNAVAVFAAFLLSIFVVIITLVNAHLYRNNVVFVTNEKLAQVLFITLFNRKISQLSIGDVQDVTVQQNGFLPNTIGYGTLVVETAGEQQNYTFSFVPHPYETSKVIINAHEQNLKSYGN